MKGINPTVFIALTVAALIFQSISAPGLTVIPITNAPSAPNGWIGVSCSADGTKLFAAAYEGGLYTSTNSGLTWISNAAPSNPWSSASSSSDGNRLAATTYSSGGQVWTNSGTNWAASSAPTSASTTYGSVAGSGDGSRLYAIRVSGSPVATFAIYASADFGATWHQSGAPNIPWNAVACSADGTKLVAVASNTNKIYTSVNLGTNWTTHAVPSNNWWSVSSSADGSKLAAITSNAGLFTSGDSGATWVSNSVPNKTWYSIASSADGSQIVSVGISAFYTTTNSGQNWTSNNPPATLLRTVACSTNGLRGIMAGVNGGTTPLLFTFAPDAVTPPPLSLLSSNAQFAVAWPSSVTGFQLQQNTNLTTSAWLNVTDAVQVADGMNEVLISPTNSASFYRLINQ